jgi:hypothetical protein
MKLLVSLDSEARMRVRCKELRTSESGHQHSQDADIAT